MHYKTMKIDVTQGESYVLKTLQGQEVRAARRWMRWANTHTSLQLHGFQAS